jgi:DNA-binding MarR family transcriptional regulator
MIKKRLEESLLLRMILVGDRLKRRRDIISQKIGISTQQWLILLHIARDPNIPFIINEDHKKDRMPNEIAATLGTSRPNVTVLMNGLLEKGLINEEKDPDDKRRKRLTLTSSGLALLDSLQAKREKLNSDLFAGFSKEEMEKTIDFLEKFIQNIESGKHEV